MGCNAWNHSLNCSCGWGGVSYGSAGAGAGAVAGGSGEAWHWLRSDSYTDPNARCPRCRASVFFYRSPYGGCVYFDELGPPWPKHPCMDTGAPPTSVRRPQLFPAVVAGTRPASTVTREQGWRPMICEEVRRHDRCQSVVCLKVRTEQGYSPMLYAVFDRSLLDHRTPFLARPLPDGSIEVSTLDTQAKTPDEVRFVAYRTLDSLPQPFRGEAKGIRLIKAADAPADSYRRLVEVNPVGKRKRQKPVEPKSVPVTFKQRSPDQVTPIAPRQQPKEASNKGTYKGINNKKQLVPQQWPKRLTAPAPEALSAKKSTAPSPPITNMALAFQRLAFSDPEVADLLITGFRPKRGS